MKEVFSRKRGTSMAGNKKNINIYNIVALEKSVVFRLY